MQPTTEFPLLLKAFVPHESRSSRGAFIFAEISPSLVPTPSPLVTSAAFKMTITAKKLLRKENLLSKVGNTLCGLQA